VGALWREEFWRRRLCECGGGLDRQFTPPEEYLRAESMHGADLRWTMAR